MKFESHDAQFSAMESVGSIPTLASNFKLLKNSKLQKPEEAVPVKVPVKIKLAQ